MNGSMFGKRGMFPFKNNFSAVADVSKLVVASPFSSLLNLARSHCLFLLKGC